MLWGKKITEKILFLFAFVLAFSLPESRRCPPIPLHLKEVSRMVLQSEKGFLSHREQNSVSGYQPRRMSWHIPPCGASRFVCCPAWRLLGVGNPVFSFSFHRGVGRAARQLALPTLSPSHPGEDWEAEIPEDGCPNNRRGSVGQLGRCLLGQRLRQHHGLSLRPGRREGDRSPGSEVQPEAVVSLSRVTPVFLGAPRTGPAWRGHLT